MSFGTSSTFAIPHNLTPSKRTPLRRCLLTELDASPLVGRFDVAHLKAIHRHIFQDVYRWTGEFRTVNISKGGHLFGVSCLCRTGVAGIAAKAIARVPFEKARPRRLGTRAGYYMREINAVHPFRDGNGRAQRELIRELAEQAGFAIDWSRVTRVQMMAAKWCSSLWRHIRSRLCSSPGTWIT
jgi:cell filamentation protein